MGCDRTRHNNKRQNTTKWDIRAGTGLDIRTKQDRTYQFDGYVLCAIWKFICLPSPFNSE